MAAPPHSHLNFFFQPSLRLFGKPNPNVSTSIVCMNREAENSQCVIIRYEPNMEAKLITYGGNQFISKILVNIWSILV